MSCYLMLCMRCTSSANTCAVTSRVINGAWYDQRARKGNARPQGFISSEGACAELNRLCQGNWVPRRKAGHTQCAWSRGEEFTLLFSQLMWLCQNLRRRLRRFPCANKSTFRLQREIRPTRRVRAAVHHFHHVAVVAAAHWSDSVSYTHLTLPTILLV